MSRSDTQQPGGKPKHGDPEYDLAAFRKDLFRGRFRWLATAFAIYMIAVLVYFSRDPARAELDWPINTNGIVTFTLVWVEVVLWSGVAAFVWIRWFRARRAA